MGDTELVANKFAFIVAPLQEVPIMPGQEMPGGIGIGLAFLADSLLRNWKENLVLLGLGFGGIGSMAIAAIKTCRAFKDKSSPPADSSLPPTENSPAPSKTRHYLELTTGMITLGATGCLVLSSGSPAAALLSVLALAVAFAQAKGDPYRTVRTLGKLSILLGIGGLALAGLLYLFSSRAI